ESYAEIGFSVAGVGDLDHDGIPDILMGDPLAAQGTALSGPVLSAGRAAVFSGANCSTLYEIGGPFFDFSRLGSAVAGLGDVDGDGTDDFAIGEPHVTPVFTSGGTGNVKIYSGATGTLIRTLTDPATDGSAGGLGSSIARLPDLTGDGVPDVLVGEPLGD